MDSSSGGLSIEPRDGHGRTRCAIPRCSIPAPFDGLRSRPPPAAPSAAASRTVPSAAASGRGAWIISRPSAMYRSVEYWVLGRLMAKAATFGDHEPLRLDLGVAA